MSSRRATAPVLAAALLGALLATGCRNPFMPSSDVTLNAIGINSSNLGGIDYPLVEMPVFAADFAGVNANYDPYRIFVAFEVHNKVAVTIYSVNIAYTDLAGNPVTVYASTGGKFIKLQARLSSVTDNTGGNGTMIVLSVLDRYVVAQLEDPAFTPKYINCELTFRGEDDNGYDVKLAGKFSIKGLNF